MTARRASVPTTMAGAVTSALKAAQLTPADAGARRLAMRYAEAIDAGADETLEDLGPKLLAVLTALGCTPAGRQKPKGEVKAGGRALDGLRSARSA
jgi:hypothetical protein